MFGNIIYFIVALFVFHISPSESTLEQPPLVDAIIILLLLIAFYAYCRFTFARIVKKYITLSTLSLYYNKTVTRLSILSLIVYSIIIYQLGFKTWIGQITFIHDFDVLYGASVISLFILLLCIIWFTSYPVYKLINTKIHVSRKNFLISNLKLNLPILFPWLIVSSIHDILSIFPLGRSLLENEAVILSSFFLFIMIMILFLPILIKYFWSCKPLSHPKAWFMENFLQIHRFSNGGLLSWPAMGGTLLTAGIMGILPRFRYIMITDSLMDLLTVDELEGVLAHEMAHAKYFHVIIYSLFLIIFVIAFHFLADLIIYGSLLLQIIPNLVLHKQLLSSISIPEITVSACFIIMFIVYLRYIMGFFMRNFERQADQYAASVMGTAEPIINALEKIGFHAGQIRNIPSWHHFSIAERVDYLRKIEKNGNVAKHHNKRIKIALTIYMLCACIGIFASQHYSSVSVSNIFFAEKILRSHISEQPYNAELHRLLAMLYHEKGEISSAISSYEKALTIDPTDAISMNNLAWIFATDKTDNIQLERALHLAEEAVAIDRSDIFLDTLAEIYFRMGRKNDAVSLIKEAINMDSPNIEYYKEQLKKFNSTH